MINKDFQKILERIKKFRDERDWMQFHNPKDMAAAISIEAGELLEQFLWKNKDEVEEYLKDPKNMQEVREEIADIIHYTLELADNLGIDIDEVSENKFKKSALKYPVEKAKGVATKYTKL